MLICAVLASLGVGVLMAYGVCLALFAMFRTHARQVESLRVAKGTGSQLEPMQG